MTTAPPSYTTSRDVTYHRPRAATPEEDLAPNNPISEERLEPGFSPSANFTGPSVLRSLDRLPNAQGTARFRRTTYGPG